MHFFFENVQSGLESCVPDPFPKALYITLKNDLPQNITDIVTRSPFGLTCIQQWKIRIMVDFK